MMDCEGPYSCSVSYLCVETARVPSTLRQRRLLGHQLSPNQGPNASVRNEENKMKFNVDIFKVTPVINQTAVE